MKAFMDDRNGIHPHNRNLRIHIFASAAAREKEQIASGLSSRSNLHVVRNQHRECLS